MPPKKITEDMLQGLEDRLNNKLHKITDDIVSIKDNVISHLFQEIGRLKTRVFKLETELYQAKLSFSADTKLFGNSSLCSYYSKLAWKCRQLKRKKKIVATWPSLWGTIMIKLTDTSIPLKIEHENDIDALFPNFFPPTEPDDYATDFVKPVNAAISTHLAPVAPVHDTAVDNPSQSAANEDDV